MKNNSIFSACPQPEAISTFTSEPALVSFAKIFCKTSDCIQRVSYTPILHLQQFQSSLPAI